ncbi:MAG: hypothetical protein GY755_03380 [Chloroflexi bacterium]|nr:hypothetical protein [Chloroflexota bacterium]
MPIKTPTFEVEIITSENSASDQISSSENDFWNIETTQLDISTISVSFNYSLDNRLLLDPIEGLVFGVRMVNCDYDISFSPSFPQAYTGTSSVKFYLDESGVCNTTQLVLMAFNLSSGNSVFEKVFDTTINLKK